MEGWISRKADVEGARRYDDILVDKRGKIMQKVLETPRHDTT